MAHTAVISPFFHCSYTSGNSPGISILALVLERLLEHKLDHKYPTGQIIDSVRKYNCTHLDTNNWQFTYYDEVIDACGKALDMNLKKKYRTQQEIQRLLRY